MLYLIYGACQRCLRYSRGVPSSRETAVMLFHGEVSNFLSSFRNICFPCFRGMRIHDQVKLVPCQAFPFTHTMDAFTPKQTIEFASRIGCKKAHMCLDKLWWNSFMAAPLLGFGYAASAFA